MKGKKLYRNPITLFNYAYPQPFKTDLVNERKSLLRPDGSSFEITVTGIPDGVSPQANEALVPRNAMNRLYIMSNEPLSDQDIDLINQFYGKNPYPIHTATRTIGQLDPEEIPYCNFYTFSGELNSVSELVEYRYIASRYERAQIAMNIDTREIHPYVSATKCLIVLIMPENFVRTGLKRGYFLFKHNLIVRVYSNYLLSSAYSDSDDKRLVSVINTSNQKLVTAIQGLFAKLQLHRFVIGSLNQIYSYDKYLTAVVGSTSNILLP